MKRGFTLIELLVVVLIMGMLAAVALPQYQKAVAKSRGVQVITFLNAFAKAADICTLENKNIENLEDMGDFDIDLSATFNAFKQINAPDPGASVDCTDFAYTGKSFDIGYKRENNKWTLSTCGGWDLQGEVICEYLQQHL